MRNLGVRLASGGVLLVLVLAAIWFRGLLLMGLLAVAAGLAAHEFYTMARRAGYLPWYPAGVALALLLALRGYLGGDVLAGVAVSGLGVAAEVMVLVVVLVFAMARQGAIWLLQPSVERGIAGAGSSRSPYVAWADVGVTLAGALYTGGLLGYAALIAALPGGPGKAGATPWLVVVVLGTAACDTGAYFVGSLVGRHKLIPHISPGKTWEGLIGGAAAPVIVTLLMAGILGLTALQAVALGALICLTAVPGDLCESLLKRATGVKDSSNLIPGHGGLLDRLDSFLFVLPAVYWFISIAGVG